MITDTELRAACDSLVAMWHEEVKPMLMEFNDLYQKIVAPARTERALKIIRKYNMNVLEFNKDYGIDGAWRATRIGGIPNTLVSFLGYSEIACITKCGSETNALWDICASRYASRQDAILNWRKTLLKLREECRHFFADNKVFVDAMLTYMDRVNKLDAKEDEEFRKAFAIEPKPKTYKVTLRIEEV